MKVLGLETSCDETGLAIFDSEQIDSDNKGLLGQVLYSQIELHALYGGVVPELASRDHIRKLVPLFFTVHDFLVGLTLKRSLCVIETKDHHCKLTMAVSSTNFNQ